MIPNADVEEGSLVAKESTYRNETTLKLLSGL